jgi:N-methylhydantoinase B
MLDGGAVGSSAGHDRDGANLYSVVVSNGMGNEKPDVEVLESWYPIFFEHRGPVKSPRGAGEHRAGRSMIEAYRTTGTEPLVSAIMGNRERVPIAGFAGGRPGGLTEFRIRGQDGQARRAPAHSQGLSLQPGEFFELEVPTGGGWGDPIERDVSLVEREVRLGRISLEEAMSIYGVVPGDPDATQQCRANLLKGRLRDARPAQRPVTASDFNESDLRQTAHPLYPGIEQRGHLAISVRTGAPLAVAPAHWTTGCPTLTEELSAAEGIRVVTYLDPRSGHALAVDVVAENVELAFETLPRRWVEATPLRHAAPQVVAAVGG